jgi:hypothetical protein
MKKVLGIILIGVGVITLPKVFSLDGLETLGGLIGVSLVTFLPAYFLLREKNNFGINQTEKPKEDILIPNEIFSSEMNNWKKDNNIMDDFIDVFADNENEEIAKEKFFELLASKNNSKISSLTIRNEIREAFEDVVNEVIIDNKKMDSISLSFLIKASIAYSIQGFKNSSMMFQLSCMDKVEYDKLIDNISEEVFDKYFESPISKTIQKESSITLFDINGIKYISTYTINQFLEKMEVSHIEIINDPETGELYFTFGSERGAVSSKGIPKNQIVSHVTNGSGESFWLLHEQADLGPSIVEFK